MNKQLPRHPLAPLTPQEITLAVEICIDQAFGKNVDLQGHKRFINIDIIEPLKENVYQFEAKSVEIDRQAKVHMICTGTPCSYELIVSLSNKKLLSFHQLNKDVQPLLKPEEFIAAENAVRGDPRCQKILLERGVKDLSLIMIDPWGAGYYGDEAEKGKRIMKTLCFTRMDKNDHGYAHPLEGICFIVDLNTMQVDVEQIETDVPIPQRKRNYSPRYYREQGIVFRDDVKPIEIVQPRGPSWTVNGENHVDWIGWSFSVGISQREGLVLHNLKFRGKTILYRASIAEMVVPYGCPHPIASRKNAFDIGEYGFGNLINSLKIGCDCLGEIHYFDAVINDLSGNPIVVKNAVCLHEEDTNVLWKHYDWRLKEGETRRNRRLVISSWVTVGNYDYGFYWYLNVDGSIQMQVKHSGIINTNAKNPNLHSHYDKYASNMGDGLCAQVHQHIYCARLDFAVDGISNSVSEVNIVPEDDELDKRGTAFYVQERVLKTEKEAQRDMNVESSRFWRIFNPNKKNHVGEPVSCVLLPATNVKHFAKERSWLFKRAPWLKHHFWVTQFAKDEMFPSGEFPNQSDGKCGGKTLEDFSQQNRSIENSDIVVWYTFGLSHVVRLEDFPVMPVVELNGFTIMPHGLFDENPVLDIPPQDKGLSHCSHSKL